MLGDGETHAPDGRHEDKGAMRSPPKELSSWVDLIQKMLVVVTLVAAVIGYGYKAYQLLSAKERQVAAEAQTAVLLTNTYTKLITDLNREIALLDEKLDHEVWKNSTGWDRTAAIREMKVRDRNELLRVLGRQVVDVQHSEPMPNKTMEPTR